jgi:trigger factor
MQKRQEILKNTSIKQMVKNQERQLEEKRKMIEDEKWAKLWYELEQKIIKENQLDVTAEELKASMKAEVMQYFGNMSLGEDTSWLDSYVDRMMKDEKQIDNSYRRLVTDKLFKWAESNATPTEKEVTPEELNGLQHHHHHWSKMIEHIKKPG